MATHVHFIEVVYKSDRLPTPADFNFSQTNPENFSGTGDFLYSIRLYHFFDSLGCREYVYSRIQGIEEGFLRSSFSGNLLLGVRGMGEMIHKTAEILDKYPKSAEILQKFLREGFGIDVTLETGDSLSKNMKGQFVGTSHIVSRKDTTRIPRHKFVTIYVPSWTNLKLTNFPEMVTGLLWLIREPSLVEKIVTRKIRGVLSLVREMISLSISRLEGSADFMVAAVYGESPDKSIEELQEHWKQSNSYPLNGEASDYLSVFHTSVFFFNKYRKVSMNSVGNGLIYCVKYNSLEKSVKRMLSAMERRSTPVHKEFLQIREALEKWSSSYKDNYPEKCFWSIYEQKTKKIP